MPPHEVEAPTVSFHELLKGRSALHQGGWGDAHRPRKVRAASVNG